MIIIFLIILLLLLILIYNKQKIPNHIHFIFGLKKQNEDFLFTYYLSVLSAYIVNKPEKIYFYYHYLPKGKWWDRMKEKIPILILEKVELPTHIGNKVIKHYAHKSDKIRMEKLYERGGIYMDIDTISLRPYHGLLKYNTVLGYEIKKDNLICNAIMLTKKKSAFFKLWLDNYIVNFNPEGWGEASIYLPGKLHKEYPHLAHVLEEDVFFRPYAYNGKDIFENNKSLPPNLITLHLWESFTKDYMKQIKDYKWILKNKHTLYSKIVSLNIKECDI
ncbi:MAG: hypothetical protein CL779_00115 [Chloroflexi bacterium]|nr:hypothetical protein [Chloroflexota bacterium]